MNIIKKRIDSLGRIVLPKQVRDELKISDFEELEIFINNENIILKKSVGIEKYKFKFDKFLLLLKKILQIDVVITDLQKIISNTDGFIQYEDLAEIDRLTNVTVQKLPLIINSYIMGYIYFIGNSNTIYDLNLLKEIQYIIEDLIR